MPVTSNTARQPVPRRLLDAAAPPLSPAARTAWLTALDDGWADPRRLYTEARRARALLDAAREVVAQALSLRPDEVSFTSSGTVARQLGLRGLLHGRRRAGTRLVLSHMEHSALLLTAQWHGDSELVGVDRLGRVNTEAFAAAVRRPGTAAASLQAANGEVGTRQPLAEVGQVCREAGVPLFVDLGSGLGRDHLPWAEGTAPPSSAGAPVEALPGAASVSQTPIGDVLVADARSWAGPPGVGVLAVRSAVRWRSDGPHDQAGLDRAPGEPDVPAILGAAAGLQDAEMHRTDRAERCRALIDELRAAVATIPDTEVVGDPVDRLPHVLTWSHLFVDGEALVSELDRRGFAVASGSACTSSALEPSHVLAAMGVLTQGNLRVTLPLDPVADDVRQLATQLPEVVAQVRAVLGADGL
ncbi:MAG: cysteine desulfurase family protein [Angustibacter sp.]